MAKDPGDSPRPRTPGRRWSSRKLVIQSKDRGWETRDRNTQNSEGS